MCSSMTESVSLMTGESALIVLVLVAEVEDGSDVRRPVCAIGDAVFCGTLVALVGLGDAAEVEEWRCWVGEVVGALSALCGVFGGPSLAQRIWKALLSMPLGAG